MWYSAWGIHGLQLHCELLVSIAEIARVVNSCFSSTGIWAVPGGMLVSQPAASVFPDIISQMPPLDSMTQYTDGVVGALVVHAKNESVPSYDGDLVLQLSDLYHTFSTALLNLYFTPGGLEGTPGNEPVPDGGVINGVGQYGDSANTPKAAFWNATLEANKTYRLRLVNTGSFVAMQFSVDNHTLTVVEADGTAVKPFEVSSVSVALAQRYSVLLRTNQSAGAYWIRAGLDQDAFTVGKLAVVRSGQY